MFILLCQKNKKFYVFWQFVSKMYVKNATNRYLCNVSLIRFWFCLCTGNYFAMMWTLFFCKRWKSHSSSLQGIDLCDFFLSIPVCNFANWYSQNMQRDWDIYGKGKEKRERVRAGELERAYWWASRSVLCHLYHTWLNDNPLLAVIQRFQCVMNLNGPRLYQHGR